MSKTLKGFTIVELLVVIAIIGVMSTIGIVSFISIQSNARNTQRSSRISILSEALERYYDNNGEYPSCAAMTASPDTVTSTTLKGLDPQVLAAPNAAKGTNSITCSNIASPDNFTYLGGVAQYTLKYKEEDSSTAPILDSRRHVVTTTYTLAINAGPGGIVSVGGTYNDGTTQTITATPSTYYSFSNWTGSTGCSGVASHTITMDANKTCTANFVATPIVPNPPSPSPTVTANTVGATTTFSWGATTCTGNTAGYQYRYTNTSGYDSGLVGTAGTSVAFTTSGEGYTYTVTVQARCYNTATTTGWSTPAGSANYYRPITVVYYTLTIAAGTGGTVNAGGSYTAGSTPTITATPSANYSFSSWSGTNCSGSASHAVPAMAADMSCTANFTYSPPQCVLTVNAGIGGTASGGGTYNCGNSQQISVIPSTYYSFSSWTGSSGCSGAATHNVTVDTNKTCTANFTPTTIPPPATPVVTATKVGTTSTWSWGAVSCPGNTTRYQYRYTISPSGYDSGLVVTAGTSVSFTTSTEGQIYLVTVQTQCYNGVTSSSWSGAGASAVQVTQPPNNHAVVSPIESFCDDAYTDAYSYNGWVITAVSSFGTEVQYTGVGYTVAQGWVRANCDDTGETYIYSVIYRSP